MTGFDPLDTAAWRRAEEALLQRFYAREIDLRELRAGLSGLGYRDLQLELELVMCMVLRETTPNEPRRPRARGELTTAVLRAQRLMPDASSVDIARACRTTAGAVRVILRRYGRSLIRDRGDRSGSRSPWDTKSSL